MSKLNLYIKEAIEKGYIIDKTGSIISPKGKLRKPSFDKDGYGSVCFKRKEGGMGYVKIHKFQAYMKFGDDAFEDEIVVRHLDGNPKNNCWDNIDIGSQSENIMDRKPEDRLDSAKKAGRASAVNSRRFSDEELSNIREYHNECKSYKKTMEKFNISSRGALHCFLKKKYA